MLRLRATLLANSVRISSTSSLNSASTSGGSGPTRDAQGRLQAGRSSGAWRKAIRRADRLQDRNEALEYQLGIALRGYGRIAGAANDHEAFMAYDSLEGRVLVSEAIVADMARRVPAMVDAARRRVCSIPHEARNISKCPVT